jgi:type VI secretion system secreted protein Hcp
MASDIFAKFGDIKGESLDSKHKDEVEVLSWSWGVNQTGTMAPGGGGGAGKASFNDFNFTHNIDKASPVLLKACATGEHIKEATITVRKAGKGQQEFLIIKMNDIIITSVAPSGAGDATAENVALKCAIVDLEYKPQKADGSLDAGVHFKYDIKGNKEG